MFSGKKKKYNLTKGPILKSLLLLAIPIVLSNILHTAYQITDTFWVGRLGAPAVAAVSMSFPIIFLLISLGGGLAIAGTVLVAQYKGKKDYENINYASGQTFLMMFFVALILTIVGYTLSSPLIKLMGADALVLPEAISYMQISFLGIIFMFIFFVFQSLMRGVGDVKIPLFIVLSTVILNLFLDPLFILGYGIIPAFGVAGAAITTVLTEGLSAIIGIIILFNGKHGIRLKVKHLRPNFRIMKKIFRLGFPASIEQSTRSLGMTIMIFVVASFGTMVTAAYGIGGRILSFVIIPALGLSMATSTLVGQNIGAGKIKRAEKVATLSMKISFFSLSIMAVILFVFANYISRFFIPQDIAVINMSANFIRIMAVSFGFVGIQIVLNGVLRGAGDTFAPMVLTVISLWTLRVPLAYCLSNFTSLSYNGIWWSFPIANIVSFVLTYIWYKKKSNWKKRKLTEDIRLTGEATEETIIDEGLS